MTASIDDVARLAGVSIATVSRALRGLPGVSAGTRDKVLRAAAALDWVPSPSAASLASGRTRTVGLLTPSISRWFHGNVIEGVERHLRTAGFDVLLYAFEVDASMARERVDPGVLRRRVDGIVVVGMVLDEQELHALEDLGLPLVFIGAGPPRHVRVHMDDVAGSALVVDELLALGHRRIGQIQGAPAGSVAWSPAVERARGADRRLAHLGPDYVETADFSVAGARAAAARLLDRVEVTAIYAHSDEMAFGVLEELAARGLRVPGDVSVAGIDGHDLGGLLGLSTLAQDAAAQGMLGGQLVLSMLDGAAPGLDVVLPVRWIARTSCASVP